MTVVTSQETTILVVLDQETTPTGEETTTELASVEEETTTRQEETATTQGQGTNKAETITTPAETRTMAVTEHGFSVGPNRTHKILPEWYRDVVHRKQQNNMKNENITIETQPPLTPPKGLTGTRKDEHIATQMQPPFIPLKGLTGLPPLVLILRLSQRPDISDEKKEWFKKPVEAKEAEVVGSWFALMIAGQIGLIIAMDVNTYRRHGRRAFRIMRGWWRRRQRRRRNVKDAQQVEKGEKERGVEEKQECVCEEIEVVEL